MTDRHPARPWHRSRGADVLLRVGGAVLLLLAWWAATRLRSDVRGTGDAAPAALDDLLAAIAFLAASIGVGMAAMGRHLFDRVAISSQWRRR